MKKIISMMMTAFLLGSSVFNLTYADSGDCQIYVLGYDSNRDGWDGGAAVTIQQEGLTDQTFTVEEALSVASIDFLEGKDMKFIWKAGSYQTEDALYIFAPNELKVFEFGDLKDAADGETIYTITATTCPTASSPVTVNDIVLNSNNTVTLSWTLNDNSKTNVSYEIVFQRVGGETYTRSNILGTTVTIDVPLEKDGEYTAHVIAKENGTPFAIGSKTQDISVNLLGDVNIKIQVNDAYGLPDTIHHYLYYRTADDLSIQNSIELTKSGNWWTGTVSAFPAAAMKIRWYVTDAEGTIVTDNSKFGTSPYTTYSTEYKIIVEQNTCFEMLIYNGTNPVLVEADCDQTPKERTPQNMTATVTPGKVVFTWSEISDANQYKLSATTDIMGTFSRTITGNTYTWYTNSETNFELSQWAIAPWKDEYILVNPAALPIVTDAQQVPANTPYVPQNLTAEFNNETRSIDISWDNVNEAVFYTVEVRDGSYVKVAETTVYSNSVSIDFKGQSAGDYTVIVQSWYSDINGVQEMGYSSVHCDVLPTALENVEVSVLIPSDCEFDVNKGVWLYWLDNDAALYRVEEAEDKGGRRYNFTFNQPSGYNNVSAFVANEKVDGETLPFTANADRSADVKIYCSSCFELADNGTHSFSINEADCSKNDHDYKPRQLHADYETAGRVMFSWQVKDYAYQYKVVFKTDEYGGVNLGTFVQSDGTGYTAGRLTTETLHVTQWTVTAYDAHGNVLSQTTKEEKFTVKPSTPSLYADNLQVNTLNGEDYTFSWKKATSTEVASYVVYIYDDLYAFDYYYKANDSTLTRKIYPGRNYQWSVYSIDKDGNRLAVAYGPDFTTNYIEDYRTVTNAKATLKGNQLTLNWQSNAPVMNVYISGVVDMYTTKNSVTVTITKSGNIDWVLYDADVDDFGHYYFYDSMAKGTVYVSPQDVAGTVYLLALSASEGGTVVCQGGEGTNIYSFIEGDNVNLNTIADKGYVFDHWSDGETSPNRTVTITEDLILKAFFREAKLCNIHISIEPSEGGLAKVNGANTSSTTVYEGSTLQLEAFANTGYEFKEWRIDGSKESSNETYSWTVKSDTYIVAVFEAVSALSSIEAESYSLRQEGLQVVVSTKSDTMMSIYNIAGQLLQQKSGSEARFTVPAAGLYIVRIGDSTEKMIIQ